jgi:hypothetical protein
MGDVTWILDGRSRPADVLGYLPYMISASDPRPAREQFDANYQHGGGWNAFHGFVLNVATMALTFPGDPPLRPIAMGQLRDERIYLYPHAWVLIIQKDGTFEVARMD